MALSKFSAKCSILTSTPSGSGYSITASVQDMSGFYSGFNVLANDILYIDISNSAIDDAMVASYEVTSVTTTTATGFAGIISYQDVIGTIPDPVDYIAQPGFITRPSTNLDLGWIAANDLQGIPAYLASYARNIDNFRKLDILKLLGVPTDGYYGNTGANVSGVTNGDTLENAFDKVEVILGKLAPTKPPLLSTKTLTISGTYTALLSGAVSQTSISNVTDDTTPLAQTPTGTANGFSDGQLGTLSASVNSTASGSRVLTTGDDTGTYTALKVLSDYDFYSGQPGKSDFWYALIAGIESTSALAVGVPHTYQLTHSTTGSTPVYTFYTDDPLTPTISGTTITGSGTGRYISGVPSLATGDTINATFTVGSAIRAFYNSTRIASASSSYTNSVNAPLPIPPPAGYTNFSANINLTVATAKYAETPAITLTGYNSKSVTGTSTPATTIRIDTVSLETPRLKSGTGQFPTKGTGVGQFSDTYVSTELLTANEELQLLNGLYQYPTGNYTANLPTAGPNYSSVAGGSYNSMRWVTFNGGNCSSAVGVTIVFNSTTGFSTTILSSFNLYVLVDGATPTLGWVDGNAAYPGVGNPTSNGDAALVIGSSTSTSKRVTFGTSVKTGAVWVRIGIPSGDTKKFSSISVTLS